MSTDQEHVRIPLTGRRPISILRADWPVIARAGHRSWAGEHESQATATLSAWLRVRRHADGRAIVYAGYASTSRWQGAHDLAYTAGELLPAGGGADDLEHAIRQVGNDCSVPESMILACIAELIAEKLTCGRG